MFADGLRRHGPQIELQTTGQHGHGYLLRVRGSQHKLEVVGGFFQCFQHGVERRVAKHVHLVNHENLEAPLYRLVDGLLQQCLHLVHPTVGGSIQLGVIDKAAAVDVGTGLAYPAGCRSDVALPVWPLTIERLGQNARHRGFADAAGAGEKVSMVQPLCGQRVTKRLNHMVLPHHFGEIAGPIFAGEHKVGHGLILRPVPGRRWRLETSPHGLTIDCDGPSRMVKRPTGSGGEPSSPNCGASAGVRLVNLISSIRFLRTSCANKYDLGQRLAT